MRITNSNFYLITITALAALLIIGLYYFSRQANCCGDCHMHEHATEQMVAQPENKPIENPIEATE